MSLRVIQFLAILLIAFALVPAGAHLFELPNKIAMPRDAYLAVQGIYAGWAWFGIANLAALVMNVVLAIKLRHQLPAVYFAAAAALAAIPLMVGTRRRGVALPTSPSAWKSSLAGRGNNAGREQGSQYP